MPAPRGHRGTHANRGPAGYCVSVTGAAGGRQPSIALKTTFGRAAGLHSPLSRPGPARPRFTVGELRHRGEGSSSHACTRGRHWGRGGDVDGRRATEARRGRLPPPRPGPPVWLLLPTSPLWLLGWAAGAARSGMALVWMTARPGPARARGAARRGSQVGREARACGVQWVQGAGGAGRGRVPAVRAGCGSSGGGPGSQARRGAAGRARGGPRARPGCAVRQRGL